MNGLDPTLPTMHSIGLAMGIAAPFADRAMGGLIAKAAPAERTVLGRFSALSSPS